MSDKILLAIVLSILALTMGTITVLRIKQICKFTTRLFLLGVGTVAADIVILLKISGIIKPLAILYAVQMAVLGTPYETVFAAIGQNEPILNISFTVMSFATPLVWAGFIASLFPVVVNGLHYFFCRLFRSVYLFSELNENSLMLAKSLSSKDKKDIKTEKCICVFCSVNRHDDAKFIEQAEESHFVLFTRQMEKYIAHTNRGKKWIYFAISSNQDMNLDAVKNILSKYSERKEDFKEKVHLYLFSEQKDAHLVSASINKKHLPLTIINKNKYIANDLFFRHPLVEPLKYGNKSLGILIIGAGRIGTELIKNSIALGQLGDDFILKVTVFDKNADEIGNQFFTEHPEIQKNYDVSFVQTTMLSEDFVKQLDRVHKEINYICICLGDDEFNIRIALFVRRFFMNNDFVPNRPFIAVETKNDIKAAGVVELNELDKKNNPTGKIENRLLENKSLDYHLHSFARNAIVYSKNIVFNKLERLALNTHFIYECERAKSIGENYDTPEVVKETYYMSEQNMRSARARVLHIASKMFIAGERFNFAQEVDREKLQNKLSDENLCQKLEQVEHERWVAYMRCEGWTRLSDSDNAVKKENYRKLREKKHYCIRPYKEMDKAEKKIGIDFKRYDSAIVRNMHKILVYENVEALYKNKYKNWK